jgi:hypothetical protein
MARLGETISRVESSKQAIVESYGEEEAAFNLDEFLKLFYEFSVNVHKARDVSNRFRSKHLSMTAL